MKDLQDLKDFDEEKLVSSPPPRFFSSELTNSSSLIYYALTNVFYHIVGYGPFIKSQLAARN